MKSSSWILLLLATWLTAFQPSLASETAVVYPRFASESDTRYNDIVEFLQTALEKTKAEYGPYTLNPSEVLMNELRYVEEVKSGEIINVIWRSTSPEMEKELIPIRICLRKGLLGYRIFLIRKEDQPRFAHIKTLKELKKLSVGQGADWGDVKVFEANHFIIRTGSSYEGLFQMLIDQRFDFFSRGIGEAFNEYEQRKFRFPDLAVENTICLYYPWPYYLFVGKKNAKLAERIEKGLNLMISDGTFDKIFLKYNKASIEKAHLKGRRLLKIQNPMLTPETPLNRKELWYVP